MNAIKELRTKTGMSQNKFASYLGIPTINISRWEQGVSEPPSYVPSLISRVMKADGYIPEEFTPSQIENLYISKQSLQNTIDSNL